MLTNCVLNSFLCSNNPIVFYKIYTSVVISNNKNNVNRFINNNNDYNKQLILLAYDKQRYPPQGPHKRHPNAGEWNVDILRRG